MAATTVQILSRSSLFRRLSPAALAEIAERTAGRTVKRGEVLQRQGESARTMYLVESGRLKLTQVTPHGQQIIVRFIGPGEPFGGVAALEAGVYPVTAEAIEATRLLVWSKQAIRHLTERHPQIHTNLMQALADHMNEALVRVRELTTAHAPQRIAHALIRLASQAGRPAEGGVLLDHAVSRQELAEMTGTTLYTVSRVLSRWEAEGVVTPGRKRILIRSLERLGRIAEAPDPGR